MLMVHRVTIPGQSLACKLLHRVAIPGQSLLLLSELLDWLRGSCPQRLESMGIQPDPDESGMNGGPFPIQFPLEPVTAMWPVCHLLGHSIFYE